METWEFDFEWLQVRHKIKDLFGKKDLPELNTILFAIGIQELGQVQDFSKEEKQDLMHIAVCQLLSTEGYYEFDGRDSEGWPHWSQVGALPKMEKQTQEKMLKQKIIEYFREK